MENTDQQCISNIIKGSTEDYIKSGEAIPFNVKLTYPGRKNKDKEEEANVMLNSVPDIINLVTNEVVKQLLERQDVINKEQRDFFYWRNRKKR